MRKENPIIAEGEIAFIEMEDDKVLAYERMLGDQKLIVFCNMDGEKHQIKLSEEWKGYKILLENYEERKDFPEENRYTMEPYELMVLGN